MTLLGRAAIMAAVALVAPAPDLAAQIASPEAHFGFAMGADGRLASADGIEQYFELVASRSDRVRLIQLGPTTEGHRTVAAIVTAPENIANLEAIRTTGLRLADPRSLSPEDALRLAATQKVVLAIGASIHASEVGATQAASELLYSLATRTDSQTLQTLRNVVVILIPMLNPDGHRLVVDWYASQKGTPYEGGPMPWLYHKYAGHDINRDGFMLNLAESQNLARFFYTDWHPQVFLTMHQTESSGPRFFVPPNADPIDPNYDPLIWRSAALLGSAMALELQRDRRTGVVSNAMYDYYWPGYEDSAPIGHNIVCLLTEVAGVKVATPITVAPSELRAGMKGLAEYKPQLNFPEPWPGGRWTLRDIVEYDLSAVRGLLYGAAVYREQLVQNFYEMGRRAVEAGERGGPFAFLILPDQRDAHATAKLENLLIEGGIEIHRALEPFRADGEPYPEGTDVILLSQPFRAYVKTLLERQNYPVRRSSADGPPERPYDVAGWTLPHQMGVTVLTIERSFQPPAMSRLTKATIPAARVWGDSRPSYWLVEARGNAGAVAINRLVAAGASPLWTVEPIQAGGFTYVAGSLVVPYLNTLEPIIGGVSRELGLRADGVRGKLPQPARAIGRARVALHKPWGENIDEGWTRWLLDNYEFRYTSIADADIRAGDLRARFDAIVLPSVPADRLISGHPRGTFPPEYSGGLGDAGLDALRAFVRAGGTLICLGQSSTLAISSFDLAVKDLASEPGNRLFCPGSIVRLELDGTHALAYGMERRTAAFCAFSAVFEPSAASGNAGEPARAAIETVGRYGSKDVLLSGWLEGEDVIAGRGAIVQANVGEGRVLLFGFPVQHRGQSHATFRLLFNSLFSAPQPDNTLPPRARARSK